MAVRIIEPGRLGTGLFGGSWSSGASANMALSVSGDGRYLVNASGTPTFLRSFSAWPVILSNPARWDEYLDYVQGLGFNCLKLQLISKWGVHAPSTYDSVAPFSSGALSTPTTAYRDRVLAFVAKTKARNLYQFTFPLYFGYDANNGNSGQGFYTEAVAAGVTVVRNWCGYWGALLKDEPHIILGLAGDCTPNHTGTTENSPQILKAILDGWYIDGGATHQVYAPHLAGEAVSTLVNPGGSYAWKLYTFYTWDTNSALCSSRALAGYAANIGPVAEVEVLYEHNTTTDINLRQQWYRSFLGGAFGLVDVGNEGSGYPDATSPVYNPTGDWATYTSDPGMPWAKICFDKLTPANWQKSVPSPSGFITAGDGSGRTSIAHAKAADGSLALLYSENGTSSYTLQVSQMASQFLAHWINPTTGAETAVTGSQPFAASGTKVFTPPSLNGDGDSLLRLVAT